MRRISYLSIIFLISIMMFGCQKQDSNDNNSDTELPGLTEISPNFGNEIASGELVYEQTEFRGSDEWLCSTADCIYTGYLSNQRTMISYFFQEQSYNLHLYEGIESETHIFLKYYDDMFHMIDGIGYSEFEYDGNGLSSDADYISLNQVQIDAINFFLIMIS